MSDWRDVECPACGSPPGISCCPLPASTGRTLQRAKPHAKRLAMAESAEYERDRRAQERDWHNDGGVD